MSSTNAHMSCWLLITTAKTSRSKIDPSSLLPKGFPIHIQIPPHRRSFIFNYKELFKRLYHIQKQKSIPSYFPQHFFHFLPDPHGHGSFLPILSLLIIGFCLGFSSALPPAEFSWFCTSLAAPNCCTSSPPL